METNETTSLHAQLRNLLAASNKEIMVQIGSNEDFTKLKQGNYSMCFAKKVGDSYNVVWYSSSRFLMMNDFSWMPLYQLFGSNVFKNNITVKEATLNQNCGLGQTCTLDQYGRLNPAVDGGSATALHFNNEYGPIHAGVSQLATGIDGRQECLPVYVSEHQNVIGTTDLTPRDSVLVWFEQNIQTSTMFMSSRPNAIELDLTDRNSVNVSYVNGEWEII